MQRGASMVDIFIQAKNFPIENPSLEMDGSIHRA